MEAPMGGGAIKIIRHPHFWKTVILFAVLVGGLWAWHYYKIRHDVQAEKTARQQLLEARQRHAPPINEKAIMPSR